MPALMIVVTYFRGPADLLRPTCRSRSSAICCPNRGQFVMPSAEPEPRALLPPRPSTQSRRPGSCRTGGMTEAGAGQVYLAHVPPWRPITILWHLRTSPNHRQSLNSPRLTPGSGLPLLAPGVWYLHVVGQPARIRPDTGRAQLR